MSKDTFRTVVGILVTMISAVAVFAWTHSDKGFHPGVPAWVKDEIKQELVDPMQRIASNQKDLANELRRQGEAMVKAGIIQPYDN